MVTNEKKNVEKSELKTNQKKNISTSVPIRVKQLTKNKLLQLLKRANKDRMGRRIKMDDILAYGVDLITDDHLADICNNALSNGDRLELLFKRILKEKSGLTKDEFLGMLLSGEISPAKFESAANSK